MGSYQYVTCFYYKKIRNNNKKSKEKGKRKKKSKLRKPGKHAGKLKQNTVGPNHVEKSEKKKRQTKHREFWYAENGPGP
jgi:hypothetical protein